LATNNPIKRMADRWKSRSWQFTLASDDSAYVVGADFLIDGGVSGHFGRGHLSLVAEVEESRPIAALISAQGNCKECGHDHKLYDQLRAVSSSSANMGKHRKRQFTTDRAIYTPPTLRVAMALLWIHFCYRSLRSDFGGDCVPFPVTRRSRRERASVLARQESVRLGRVAPEGGGCLDNRAESN